MEENKYTEDNPHGGKYQELRDAFEQLSAEDRAAFLIEATFKTVAVTFEEAGRQASEVFARVAREAEGWCKEAAEQARQKGQAEEKRNEEKRNGAGPSSPGGTGTADHIDL